MTPVAVKGLDMLTDLYYIHLGVYVWSMYIRGR